MNVSIETVVAEVSSYLTQELKQKQFGDVGITITLNEGIPVKIQTSFVEHLSKRHTNKVIVNK